MGVIISNHYARISIKQTSILGGGFNDFLIFTPKIGEDEPILTNTFQMGWNHQLRTGSCFILWCILY